MSRIPAMSKGHFVLVAEILRQARDASPDHAAFDRTVLADTVAKLAYSNARFDKARFVRAATEA